ncbi:MAG: DNA helicase RecQ [Microgenomates group bacterium]
MPKVSVKKLFQNAQDLLKETFGFKAFHPTQETAIHAVLAGKDALVIMPTGGGKSMCYQIPAMVLGGISIVVSPLIALMKDQVDALRANGVAAEFLNSSIPPERQHEIITDVLEGNVALLYVSAERLLSPDFIKILKKITPKLFAIDEAHCISAWGHDFRPDYTRLSQIKSLFPKTPLIALTATADEITRQDIITQLELNSPLVLIDSFDRPGISLSVLPGQNRIQKITEFVSDKVGQSGIIYCLTRKKTESIAKKLQQTGFTAASYHAGMSSADRSKIQKSFVRDKTQIICATIAFGMGIDKSNVRWIIHYNLPKNIEGYYQEIGRAGRDSAPAQALLFYSYADVEMIKKFFIDVKQGALQLAKLERMKEFAEGVICRRKILLQYFGETYPKNCNNCDVCESPYTTRNGTKITESILNLIIDLSSDGYISTTQLISALTKSSDKVNFASWYFYLAQLKNQGIIDINFAKNQSLFVTKKGTEILKKKKPVRLVLLDTFIERQENIGKSTKKRSKKKPKKDYFKNPLYEKLREIRYDLAQKNSLAAYMVFSDATLLEMAHEKPKNKSEMLGISGVGEIKWERYGESFLQAIRDT